MYLVCGNGDRLVPVLVTPERVVLPGQPTYPTLEAAQAVADKFNATDAPEDDDDDPSWWDDEELSAMGWQYID